MQHKSFLMQPKWIQTQKNDMVFADRIDLEGCRKAILKTKPRIRLRRNQQFAFEENK